MAGAPGADPAPQSGVPERATEDTDRAWNDSTDSNDDQLERDVPPHW